MPRFWLPEMTLRARGSAPPTTAGPSTPTPTGLPRALVPVASVPIRLPSRSVPLVCTRVASFSVGPSTLPGAVPGTEVSPPITVPGEGRRR